MPAEGKSKKAKGKSSSRSPECVTNDLVRRVVEHKSEVDPTCFTARYHLHDLVYFETTENPRSAIVREKQIKNMSRAEKLALIRSVNPEFRDLFAEIAPEVAAWLLEFRAGT